MAQREVDVCVVGSGGAGSALTRRLAEGGLSVVVLEAGARYRPDVDFRNDEAEMLKLLWNDPRVLVGPHPYTVGAGNCVGGGTAPWTAVCLRFHPADFNIRTHHGVGQDWPISYRELEPYYDQVERDLGVSGGMLSPKGVPSGRYPNAAHRYGPVARALLPGCEALELDPRPGPVAINSREYDGRPACVYCGFCLQGCPIGAKASALNTYIPKAEAAGAEIRPNCFAIRVNLSRDGRARSVTYIDPRRNEQEQPARVIVVAAGAIETPRLLLNSSCGSFPQGLANSSGLVGVNMMAHPNCSVYGRFPFPVDGYRGYPGGNLIVQDCYQSGPRDDYVRGFTLESGFFPPMFFAMSATSLWGQRFKEFMRDYRYYAGFWIVCEGLPNDENRLSLDPQVVDERGLPVARVYHTWVENDLKLLAKAKELSAEIIKAAGAEKIFIGPDGAAHSMGSCRMGTDPNNSVVDPNCRCHDVPNLFVCDTSVFVSGAAVNAGLTGMAIGYRTADFILRSGARREL